MKRFLLFYLLLIAFSVFSQDNYWQKIDNYFAGKIKMPKHSPERYQLYRLNFKDFSSDLKKAGKQFKKVTDVYINLPGDDSKVKSYRVYQSGTLSPELIDRFTNLRTYRAYSKNNSEQVSIVVSKWGVYIEIFRNGKPPLLIQPVDKKSGVYMLYNKKDLINDHPFECLTKAKENRNTDIANRIKASDNVLRRYRYAVATTGEYSQYHIQLAIDAGIIDADATDDEKKEVVLAAVTTSVDRVNTVYERDLGIQLELVPDETDVIFLDPDNDPYDNTDIGSMVNANTGVINQYIGSSNYDGGHLFTTYPGGGLSGLGVICNYYYKAASVTGSDNPIGDPYDIDYVAHEVGHSFGANHTFANSCDGNRNLDTSIEPGSGSTIMAYAGVCAPNVQGSSDAYFHIVSIKEITDYITLGGGSCAEQIDIGNTAPVVSYTNYSNKYIPKSTPFMLTASATDNENDLLTYAWEEVDPVTDESINEYEPDSTNTSGPMFRSYWPTERNTRYFPTIPYILSGDYGYQWEVLPAVSRSLNFNITVRDNHPGGGQSPYASLAVQVDDTTGPFRVTSQENDETWLEGETKTITWDVAGTTGGNVQCPTVDILLSTNGGESFDVVLASNVANDGEETITVPSGLQSPDGVLMVKGHDRYFFDLAKGNISLGEFETNCSTYENNTSYTIPDANSSGVESTINVPDQITISDVNVSVNISHTYIQDLFIKLTSPSGKEVILYDRNCEDQDNIIATFDDEGVALDCDSLTGNVIPVGELSDFKDENAAGTWTLFISDNVAQDIGQLNNWALEICEIEQISAVADNNIKFLTVWPNPAKEGVNVSFDTDTENKKVQIEILDISGRQIIRKEYETTQSRFAEKINLSGLCKGVYLMNIQYGSKNSTRKIILE